MTEKNIQQCMNLVFNEIQSDIYNIPRNILYRIEKYISNCKIHFILPENLDNEPDKSIAKIVEKFDYFSPDRLLLTPYLYIVKEQKKLLGDEILFHEIMHLFSVGDCFQTNSLNLFSHRSGLDLYHIYTTGETVRINQCSFLNELLNDSIAAFLYEKLIQKPYLGNSLFSCLHFRDFLIQQLEKKSFTKEQLIKSYFSHYDKPLEDILLINSVQNLNQLDNKIYESYIQKATLLNLLQKENIYR